MSFDYLYKEIRPMNLFRTVAFVISMALMVPLVSSATATTDYSHPQFSVTEDSRLNLRETGSQIVMETIEDALRQGGVALLGKGFKLDSSLNYIFGGGENSITGEADIVIPLFGGERQAVFLQPGVVFWTGLEDEERTDGNIGLVYRAANLTGDLTTGISVFYDHNLQVGHSRVSGGMDLQSGWFRASLNYYHPLSDTENGREGYIEDALQGANARLAVESETARIGGNVGYWKFQGEDDVEDVWKISYGADVGVRILPGVFIEGGWEQHDAEVSLEERWNVGFAFRFSLPDFGGASYGRRRMSTDLYKIVNREKRILYEEREAVPKVRLSAGTSETDGNVRNITIRLDEVFTQNVVLNFIGSGSATYGTGGDWTMSVGGEVCDTVTGTDCQVTVPAGEELAADEVVITLEEPERGERSKDIILSVVIASTGVELAPGNPLVVQIPAGPPLPTVSLRASSVEIEEGSTATLTLTLNEELESDATFNLIGLGNATYGTSADDDWNLNVDGTDCDMATRSSPCQVTISQGVTSAEVTVEVNADATVEPRELFTVSVEVDSGSASIVQAGDLSSLNFAIPTGAALTLPTVSLRRTNPGMDTAEGGTETITLTLSESLTGNATFNLIAGGTEATYGTSTGDDWNLSVGGTDCDMASESNPCQVTIMGGDTSAEVTVEVHADATIEPRELFTVSVEVDSGSAGIVQAGDPSSLNFAIPTDAALTLPTVTLTRTNPGMDTAEGGTETITLTLSESLGGNATFNLIAGGTEATYGTSTGDDWNLSVGGTDCDMAGQSAPLCQVTIMGGATSAEVTVEVHADTTTETTPETFTVSVEVDSGSTGIVQQGSPSSLEFTIPEDPSLPTVTLTRTNPGMDTAEGGTETITLTLSESLGGNATFNLIAGGTEATYGTSTGDDWNLSVGGTDCDMAGQSAPLCQVTIMGGATSAEVTVEVNADTTTESSSETFTVSVEVDSGSASIVQTGSSSMLNFTIPADSTLPTVSLMADKTTIAEGETATITLTLSEAIGTTSTLFVLTGSNDDAEYSSFDDYHFTINQNMAICTRMCQVDIPANQTSVEVTVNVNADSFNETTAETFTASLAVQSLSAGIVALGSPSSLDFTIPAEDPLPTVTLTRTNAGMDTAEGGTETITLTLSESLADDAKFNLIAGGTGATYGTSTGDDWNLSVNGTDCDMAGRSAPLCQVTITGGATSAEVTVEVSGDTTDEPREAFSVSVEVDSGSAGIVQAGSPSSLSFHIAGTPTVSLNAPDLSIGTGESTTLTVTLSEPLTSNAIFNLIGTGSGTAAYGTTAGWDLTVGSNAPCETATQLGPCAVEIMAGATSAEVTVEVNALNSRRANSNTFTVEVQADSNNMNSVLLGSPSTLTFTIPADPPLPTVSLTRANPGTEIAEGGMETLTLTLSGALSADAKFTLIGVREDDTTTAEYGTDKDWNLSVNGIDCMRAQNTTDCQVTITMGQTTGTAVVKVHADTMGDNEETFTVSLEVDSGSSRHIVQVASASSSLDFTIPADSPNISFSAATHVGIDEGVASSATITINIFPPPTGMISIPLTTTGSHAAYGDNIAVSMSDTSGATVSGKPSTNDVMVSVPANADTVILEITAAQDSGNNVDNITISLGTPLPGNYMPGTHSSWRISIHDDD